MGDQARAGLITIATDRGGTTPMGACAPTLAEGVMSVDSNAFWATRIDYMARRASKGTG